LVFSPRKPRIETTVITRIANMGIKYLTVIVVL